MELRSLMTTAVEPVLKIVEGIGPGQMDGPTPCPDYDVRALLGHLLHWTGTRAEAAARKGPYPAGPEEGHDYTAEEGWAERYADRARAAAAAWSEPAAWTGESSLSGTATMPAETIGGMVFGEWIVHGWDLAAATGQRLVLDDDLVRAVHERIAAMADMARTYGAFGPAVPVPADAPPLDRALALAGRDPAWRP